MIDRLRHYHVRLWHRPIRPEGYAAFRILIAFFLLMEQLFIYLPNLGLLYGPDGLAPAGINDEWMLRNWRWPLYLFSTDNMTLVSLGFACWVAATVCMLIGWKTKWASILVWLGALCFLTRNPNFKNGGDDVLTLCLFYLMFMPTEKAFSMDRRAKRLSLNESLRIKVPPWGIRLMQWQLACIYVTTGMAKLQGTMWWEGSAIHYVLHDTGRSHFSFGLFALPYVLTQLMTWVSVWWEVLFLPLVWYRKTRKWTLLMGIGFHMGIFFSIEVGFFSFYTLAMYTVFIPDAWWEKRGRLKAAARLGEKGIDDKSMSSEPSAS